MKHELLIELIFRIPWWIPLIFLSSSTKALKNLNCEFYSDKNYGYTCRIMNESLQPNCPETINFNGDKKDKLLTRYLRFENSDVRIIPDEAILQNFPTLTQLGIVFHSIKRIDSSLFINSSYLKVVDLYDNQIKIVSDDAFVNIHNMEVIVLQKNLLTFLGSRVFRNNKKLTTIYLHENNIFILDPKIFDGLGYLRSLNLEGNYCINESFPIYSSDISYVKRKLNMCFLNYAGSEHKLTAKSVHLAEDNKDSINKILWGQYGLIAIQAVFTLILIVVTYFNFKLWRKINEILA